MSEPGRRCVVTGATSGIGYAVTRRLVAGGDTVLGVGRDLGKLRAAHAEFGDSFIPAEADVADPAQVDRIFGDFGELDVLVVNAGRCDEARLDDTHADEVWHQLLQVNLSGAYYCLRAARPYLRAGGAVVTVSSGLGKLGRAGYSAYAASKHGLLGLTKSVAAELAPDRINVNAVCPGWVDTSMARADVDRAAQRAGMSSVEFHKQASEGIPLGRFVQAREVAELILWLSSPAAAAVTGQAYNISGGEFFA